MLQERERTRMLRQRVGLLQLWAHAAEIRWTHFRVRSHKKSSCNVLVPKNIEFPCGNTCVSASCWKRSRVRSYKKSSCSEEVFQAGCCSVLHCVAVCCGCGHTGPRRVTRALVCGAAKGRAMKHFVEAVKLHNIFFAKARPPDCL